MLSPLRKRKIEGDVARFSDLSQIPPSSLEISFANDSNRIDLAFRGPSNVHTLICDSEYHDFRSQLHLMRMTLLAVDVATSMKEE